MPINPTDISWDSTPSIGAPKPSTVQWDSPAPAKPAANGNYSDGSYDFHNSNGILGWLQTADRMSGRSAQRLVGGLERFGQGVAQNVGLDGVASYLGKDAALAEGQAAEPVPGAVQWDDVKAHPNVGNIASYIGQGAIGAAPDLAAAAVAPWLYGSSRLGDVAHQRAVNDGHGETMGLKDMAIAAPVAAVDTALMKYGLGGIAGEGKGILSGMVRAAGRDAVMGAGQPVVDYAGETVGTDKGNFDWREAGDRAAAGAVAMAPFGAAAHLAVRGARAMGKPEEPGPSPEQPMTVRDQLSPEQADALTLHGIDVDTLEDPNMARRAADRLLARKAPEAEAAPVIATRHGNVAPNADAQGRDFGTIDSNGGDERAKFERRVGGAENATGDHTAKNPRSSASGDFQFTDDTFVRTYQRRFGNGESRESILAKKNNPRIQSVLMRDLTSANEDVMRRSGVPLTAGNYYLSHFAGAGGAVKLHRNLDAPVERILGQKAVDANPFLKGMTGRDVVQWAANKMGEAKAPVMAAGHMVDFPVRPSERGDDPIYRAPDHSAADTGAYGFDPAEAPQHQRKPFDATTLNMGEGDGGGRTSRTAEELAREGATKPGEGMATGGMGRPFKADPSTADFENLQRERVKRAEAETEKRFEARRAEAERMKAEFEARKNRSGQSDASARYQNFGTQPHFDTETGFHRTTDDGFVADVNGNPVVWPTQGAAAKWAARFKMGGDFELQAHGTSKRNGEQPVTLQRKPGSTYGQEASARPSEGGTPQLEHIEWHDETPAPAEPANREGGDTSTGAEGETFPGDLTAEQTRANVAKTAFERARPEDPGREPAKPGTFFSDVAAHLAAEKKRTGQSVKISAEDAINHGVPAEHIYNNPNDRYPTLKANAAKVFASTKAPLRNRGKEHKIVPLDHLGDKFNPTDYGAPSGDGVQGHRLAPEHAGDLLRRSMEGDHSARNQADPRFDAHKDWMERMDALQEFEARFGDDWTKLTDDELAQLDPSTFDAFYDDVLQAAERPDVDPFDPRFWENEGEQAHQGQAAAAASGGREDHGQPERDASQPDDGAQGHQNGGAEPSHDFLGERPGDRREALERKAEEPLRGKKEQKAPGSDGGLFDDHSHGERQGTLLRDDVADGYKYDTFRDLPRNNIPEGVLKDGMEADRAFNWIAENSKDEFHRDLANTLVDLTEGVKINLYDRTSKSHALYGDTLRSAHGAVIHKDGQARIFLNTGKFSRGLTEETLLHEGIHAALATRIGAFRSVDHASVDAARGFGQDVRRIKVLQRAVADHVAMLDSTGKFREKNYAYETMKAAHTASENVDEFLTYALTDKEFQRMLSEIKVGDTYGETARLTAWQKFVNVARRIIGLPAKYEAPFVKLLDADNALNSTIDTANEHFDRLAETPAKEQTDAGYKEKFDGGVLLSKLMKDESGSLDLGKVADFFVDRDTMRDAKDGLKSMGAALKGTSAHNVLAKVGDVASHNRFVPSYFYSIDARMRGLAKRFKSPTIGKLADMFHARSGMADGTSRTYHEGVEFNSKRWNKVLFDTLHPFASDAAAMERIRNIVTKTGSGSKDEIAAAARVSKMLKEIHDYRLDAGEDLGEVADGYFPRILDPEAVVAKPDDFKALAADLFVKSGVDAKDAKVRAEMWFHQVVNENAGLDGAILDVRRAKAPGTTSGLSRKLGKEADAVLAKFYAKDPLDVLSAYITGSAKRAEFNRRFGMVGREGSKERADWTAANGSKDQLDVIRKSINDEILASDRDPGDAQDLINSLLEANLGILGKASRTMRLGTSLAHAYNQIGKMDHSLITSFNELAMGFVRGGPVQGVKFLGTTVKEFGRELMKMEPSEARRYAEHLGLILNPMMDQVLQSRISAVEGTRGLNKLVSRFYKVIGLHQFTEAERIAAAQMARTHLNVLSGDLASSNTRTVRRAERALAELGINDHAAFKSWIDARGGKARFDEIDADTGMAAKWTTAVARMTDQTVMNPTRAVKPLWANHPVGSLLYGLMSYTFAFKKNVLDRAARMAVRGVAEKDAHLLMPLLFGLPVLGAFTYLNDTYLRPAIFGSTYDYEDETAPMALLRTADRASMLGMASPFLNAMFGQKYNRSLAEAFAGSFAGSTLQGAEKIIINPVKAKVNGTEGNGAARGQAGAIYDLAIEPVLDGVLAGAVGGKLATAGIYASGTRPNSAVFPSDREAFIDAMAGPADEKSKKGPFDAKSAFDDTFDKAGGADAFDKQFK